MNRNQLIEENIKLVYHVVNKYFKNCVIMDRDDLVQEGSLGLMKAAEEWDETKGVKFSTYASNNIKWHIQNTLRSTNLLKVSTGAMEIVSMIRKRGLVDKSSSEISKAIGRTETAVQYALDYMKTSLVSTSTRIAEGEEGELHEILPEFMVHEDHDYNVLKDQILSYVSEVYRPVLKLSAEGYDTKQIAGILGITEQQASSKVTHGRKRAREYRHLFQEVM